MRSGEEGLWGGVGREQEVLGDSSWEFACSSVQKKPLKPRHMLRNMWSGVAQRPVSLAFLVAKLQDLR